VAWQAVELHRYWAGRGLASLSTCHRWLPGWLPASRQASIRIRQRASQWFEWRLSFAGHLRHLGNQARDYPRPKAATSGRDRPTLSTAAPDPPSALPIPASLEAARPVRRPHSTARGSNTGDRPTSSHSRTAADRSPRTAGTARRSPAHRDPPVHRNQTSCRVHDVTLGARSCRPIARNRQDRSAIANSGRCLNACLYTDWHAYRGLGTG